MGNELAIHSASERVQYIGLALHISPDEVQTLLDLSELYDRIYYEYIAAMMCGVIRYGNIMFPNYYWKRSHIREQIEKCTEEFEYDGVYRYVSQWTIQYVLQSAYNAFRADYIDANNSGKHWAQFRGNLSAKNKELIKWARRLSEQYSNGKYGYATYRYTAGANIIPYDRYRKIEQDLLTRQCVKLPKMARFIIKGTNYEKLKYISTVKTIRIVIRKNSSVYQLSSAKASATIRHVVYCNLVAVVSDTPNAMYQEKHPVDDDQAFLRSMMPKMRIRTNHPRDGEGFILLESIPGGRFDQYMKQLEAKHNEARF